MSSRNEGLVTSSFKWPSHDSCRCSISSARRSLCSGLRFSTHFPLSNFFAGADAEAVEPTADSGFVLKIEAFGGAAIVAGDVAETDVCECRDDVSSLSVGEDGGCAEDDGGSEEVEAAAT